MSGAIIVLAAVVLFLVGVFTGVVAIVSYAIRREDQRNSLTRAPLGRTARGARQVTGVWVTRW